MNVNVAVWERNGAFSAVIRDSNGRFVGGFSRKILYIIDPSILEALAIREVLAWLKERRKSKVIVESDCLQVCNGINKGNVMNSELGVIIQDCMHLLSTLVDV